MEIIMRPLHFLLHLCKDLDVNHRFYQLILKRFREYEEKMCDSEQQKDSTPD